MKAERTIVIKENENIEEIEQYEEEIIKLLAKILIEIQDYIKILIYTLDKNNSFEIYCVV
ncbi:MAG: hypothetical protein V8T43_01965 [Eubacteriales bacterium]